MLILLEHKTEYFVDKNGYREENQLAGKTSNLRSTKKKGLFSKLKMFKQGQEEEVDFGALEDINKVTVVSGGIGSMFPRWKDFYGVF